VAKTVAQAGNRYTAALTAAVKRGARARPVDRENISAEGIIADKPFGENRAASAARAQPALTVTDSVSAGARNLSARGGPGLPAVADAAAAPKTHSRSDHASDVREGHASSAPAANASTDSGSIGRNRRHAERVVYSEIIGDY
jgi:hypothetical protein